MNKRKNVADMSNIELDYELAKATKEGERYPTWLKKVGATDTRLNFQVWAASEDWSPTSHWEQAGKLLDRFDMTLSIAEEFPDGTRNYLAEAWGNLRTGSSIRARGMGPTRLVAICRCAAVVHFGNDV